MPRIKPSRFSECDQQLYRGPNRVHRYPIVLDDVFSAADQYYRDEIASFAVGLAKVEQQTASSTSENLQAKIDHLQVELDGIRRRQSEPQRINHQNQLRQQGIERKRAELELMIRNANRALRGLTQETLNALQADNRARMLRERKVDQSVELLSLPQSLDRNTTEKAALTRLVEDARQELVDLSQLPEASAVQEYSQQQLNIMARRSVELTERLKTYRRLQSKLGFYEQLQQVRSIQNLTESQAAYVLGHKLLSDQREPVLLPRDRKQGERYIHFAIAVANQSKYTIDRASAEFYEQTEMAQRRDKTGNGASQFTVGEGRTRLQVRFPSGLSVQQQQGIDSVINMLLDNPQCRSALLASRGTAIENGAVTAHLVAQSHFHVLNDARVNALVNVNSAVWRSHFRAPVVVPLVLGVGDGSRYACVLRINGRRIELVRAAYATQQLRERLLAMTDTPDGVMLLEDRLAHDPASENKGHEGRSGHVGRQPGIGVLMAKPMGLRASTVNCDGDAKSAVPSVSKGAGDFAIRRLQPIKGKRIGVVNGRILRLCRYIAENLPYVRDGFAGKDTFSRVVGAGFTKEVKVKAALEALLRLLGAPSEFNPEDTGRDRTHYLYALTQTRHSVSLMRCIKGSRYSKLCEAFMGSAGLDKIRAGASPADVATELMGKSVTSNQLTDEVRTAISKIARNPLMKHLNGKCNQLNGYATKLQHAAGLDAHAITTPTGLKAR